MQAVMRTLRAIDIAQYGIARLMLIVDQRVIPGTQSITMRMSDRATEVRNIRLGNTTQYQPKCEKNIQNRYSWNDTAIHLETRC